MIPFVSSDIYCNLICHQSIIFSKRVYCIILEANDYRKKTSQANTNQNFVNMFGAYVLLNSNAQKIKYEIIPIFKICTKDKILQIKMMIVILIPYIN